MYVCMYVCVCVCVLTWVSVQKRNVLITKNAVCVMNLYWNDVDK